MNKGHLELWELGLAALLIIGVVAGVYILMNAMGAQPAQTNATVPTTPEITETAPPSNGSAPVAARSPEPAAQVIPQVNKTLGTLMEESLARADSRFYKGDVSGDIRIQTFHWYLGDPDKLPDSVPVKLNDLRAADVRFDGKYDDALRAFVFRTYETKDAAVPTKIFATAIFLSNLTPFDSGNPAKIYYGTHPQGAQMIEGCTVLSKNQSMVNISVISIYDLACKVMYEAN